MNEVDNEGIFEDIIKHIEKPIFTYEEKYNFNESWSKIKKNPFKKTRIVYFLKIFIITTIICLLSSKKIYNSINIPINYILTLTISFAISIIMTIQLIKSKVKKISKKVNNKILFYDNTLIIKSIKGIFRFNYNQLYQINETNNSFVIYFNRYSSIMIEKNKIDNKKIDFIKNIQSNYKNNINNEDIWDSIDKYIKKTANISCKNSANEETINQHYNLKKIRKQFFNYHYLYGVISLFLITALIYPFNYFSLNYTILLFIFIPIIALIMNFAFIDRNIDIFKNRLIKELKKRLFDNFKFYFYDNFIIIKTDIKILKYKYTDIKYTLDNGKYLFIKFKFLKSKLGFTPLKIDKNKLTEKETNFLQEKITIKPDSI